MKYRVVLDTNQILAAGSKWLDPLEDVPSSPARALLKKVAKEHTGLYCSKIFGEYAEKLVEKGHPPGRVSEFLHLILGLFERVDLVSTSCPFEPADQDDRYFVLCALDGDADLLVSDDGHLLALQPHYEKPEIMNQPNALAKLGTAA